MVDDFTELGIVGVPYSWARGQMRIGDQLGMRGSGFISKLILKRKGGKYRWSHMASIYTDTFTSFTQRVSLVEAVSGGLRINFLSDAYCALHGEVFWMPMDMELHQRFNYADLIEKHVGRMRKYDTWNTISAAWKRMKLDESKFNCSEFSWYGCTRVGRCARVFHVDKPEIELAPPPGDFPWWVTLKPVIYKLDMSA